MIPVGRISGIYGVKGWVKVFSYTEPRDNILRYAPWYLRKGESWEPAECVDGSRHGKGVIAHLANCEDRDQARTLMNTEIGVRRDQLPDTAPGVYYWQDLIGLEVVNLQGRPLGRVDHLIATGANDVLAVKGERARLIPFVVDQIVTRVDLDAGVIEVDWDEDF